MVDQAGGGAAQLHSAPGAWGAGQGQGHRRPFLGRGVGASLGVEVQVDVEVGEVVEVVEVEEVVEVQLEEVREVEDEEVEGGSIAPSSWEGFAGRGSR